MAEDEDGVSDKKSPQNSNNGGPSQENESNASRPDLGIEETKYNSADSGDSSSAEAKRTSSKSGSGARKEENPFSFRHFLKRDLSLPGTSTYESTGARPKVYASTVQHSPTRDERRERRDPRAAEPTPPRDLCADCSVPHPDNTSSGSSVEIPFSVGVDNSDSKHNFYSEANEVPFYHRPNIASEPLGMPSLPDFVQDHILVEQAYLNPNGPISVDLDNLPDFTFNTNFNVGSSSSLGRRNNTNYGGRDYDYDGYMARLSDLQQEEREVPLDLPAGAEGAAAVPLDLPPHLNLDLTESVNPSDRRNMSPRNTFPLDLPPNAGAESMRLPDFLPVHPGRTSPEPEHQDEQLQQIMSELERTRAELFAERSRRCRVEEELSNAREEARLFLAEANAARASGEAARDCYNNARRRDRDYTGQLDEAAARVESVVHDTTARAADAEETIAKLKQQIKKLKEELCESQAQVAALRSVQGAAAGDLRRATGVAELSLRDLLAGLEQLKSLSTRLDPT